MTRFLLGAACATLLLATGAYAGEPPAVGSAAPEFRL